MHDDRNFFDDTFGHVNNVADTTGLVAGVVHAKYDATHRVDVYVPEYDQIIANIRVGTPWTGGPNTGVHALPPVGTPVQLKLQRPNKRYWSAHGGEAEVVHSNFGAENKPPQPAVVKNESNYYLVQSHISQGDEISPGSTHLLDDKGGVHDLHMGKGSHQAMGIQDERAKGISLTGAEKKALDASNALAAASEMASKITDSASTAAQSAEGLSSMSARFKSMGQSVGVGNQAMTESAVAFGAQINSQADALGVHANAAGLATGNPSIDSLVGG